jgi:acetolactate synthase-1/2/3 large subunit
MCLQADGSAMYTVQALWMMTRENLDITTVILNNSSHALLTIELAKVGITNPSLTALSMLDLPNPVMDWVKISEGHCVPAVRATTVAEFRTALRDAFTHKGPRLIEALPPALGT